MLTLSAVWGLGILGSLSACPFPVLESSQDRGRVSMDFYPHPSSSPLLKGSNTCISVLVNGNGVIASVRKKVSVSVYMCRGVSRGTHSRMAERTRLFPEREYSGKY